MTLADMRRFPGLPEIACLLLITAGVVVAVSQCACVPASSARPAAYATELTACSETSTTLAASIACENGVRARYGRPPRVVFMVADAGSLDLDGGPR